MRYNDVEPYAPLESEDDMAMLVFDIEDFLSTDEGPILLTLDFVTQE
jgi:hypothetical protein